MSPKHPPRTRSMSRGDVTVRAATARKYQDVAELVMGEDSADRHVAAGLAVLAAIAASDAICGATLRECARDQDHSRAADLLATVAPDGKELSVRLRKVLDEKTAAHYGTSFLSPQQSAYMVKHSRSLVDSMEGYVGRP
ncbi:hypothetical protein GCM10010413_07960 [Promicromonospora sukumoe]|uniref:HEPN domain-containing protein n=1 Tax=Promicromonospora sukumoe TaxID=88382 RepID=A0A7W3J573_9MICO|nr:hypothetical protein [Promicromonospora sukumoe]MBA8806468.1 hypothetical protein [Promicromonospora sukumoe]